MRNMDDKKCTITLMSVGNDKHKVIATIREILGMGTIQARDIVEGFMPYTFQEKYPMASTIILEDKLAKVGATIKWELVEEGKSTTISTETTSYDTYHSYSPYLEKEKTHIENGRSTTRQELIDYFNDVFELESQIYTYKRIEQEYANKINSMGVPRTFYFSMNSDGIPSITDLHSEPILKPEWLETQEYLEITSISPKVRKGGNIMARSLWTIFSLFICALVLIFLISRGALIVGLLICAPFLFFLIRSGYDNIDEKLPISTIEDQEIENLKFTYFMKRTKNEEICIAENEKALKPHMEKECVELVIMPKENTKTLLNKLYSKNIIFPKYRNFAAIAQIYEYLLSGRCDQLEGTNGAYNLYESELRQNIIIDKLDEIINQLENLNATMNVMCGAIQRTNHLLSGISMTLGQIEANTALTSYNTQCIAYNTNLANRYHYY